MGLLVNWKKEKYKNYFIRKEEWTMNEYIQKMCGLNFTVHAETANHDRSYKSITTIKYAINWKSCKTWKTQLDLLLPTLIQWLKTKSRVTWTFEWQVQHWNNVQTTKRFVSDSKWDIHPTIHPSSNLVYLYRVFGEMLPFSSSHLA